MNHQPGTVNGLGIGGKKSLFMQANKDLLGRKIEQFYKVNYERSWSYIMQVLIKIRHLSTTDLTSDEQEYTKVFHWGEILQAVQTLDLTEVLTCIDSFLDWYNELPMNTFVSIVPQNTTKKLAAQATDGLGSV